MLNAVTKAGTLAPYLKATSQAVASGMRPAAALATSSEKITVSPQPLATTTESLHATLPTRNIKVSSGPAFSTQVRYSHTDVSIPDFSHYRRSATTDPNQSSNESAEARKAYSYMVAGGGAIVGVYAAKSVVHHFVKYMAAAADILAMSKIEINLQDIPEGKSVTFKWRGKPLFVRHRTGSEIKTEQAVPMSELRDPEPDSVRARDPAWLVVVGVCTHLGCVPIANAGEFGGYYCPCHGSHYDAAGRIRKGPAPLNLEVPAYIVNGDLLIVG